MSQGWYALKLNRMAHDSVLLFLYPFHGRTYYLKWAAAGAPTCFLGQSLKLIDNVQELHALDNMLDDDEVENAYECQVTKKIRSFCFSARGSWGFPMIWFCGTGFAGVSRKAWGGLASGFSCSSFCTR